MPLIGGIMASIIFKKKPNKKNLTNRSLSFQNSEIELVKLDDEVKIKIYAGLSIMIVINLPGHQFINSLEDVGSSDYKVLRFT